MSGATAGPSYRIEFDTDPTGTLGTPIIQAFPVDLDAALAIQELETQIGNVYDAFEFSEVSHHTAQASAVEINCTNAAIQPGAHEIYLHGNFGNADEGFKVVNIGAGSDAGDIADEIEMVLRTNRRSLFSVDRSGNLITLRSTGRVNFWIGDNEDDENFNFSTDTWITRPAVRELEPEFGSRRETGNRPIDIGSDAGLSVLINTMQNENPTNTAEWTPNDGVDYWIELDTVVEGTSASATEEIIRIAIEDDFNTGADLGDYPNNIPDCIELAGFNSVTHEAGDVFSFPTGGSIRNQSTPNTWAITDLSLIHI